VSFNQIFGSNVKNLPKDFSPEWMKKFAEIGLMMKMIFEDKKKSKNSMTMECTSLEKIDFSIDITKYVSMKGTFGGFLVGLSRNIKRYSCTYRSFTFI